MCIWGEGWLSGKMSDCDARGQVVSSNPGRGKKNLRKWWAVMEIVNIYLCSVCPMLSMRSLRFMIVLYKLRHVWCEPSACIAA